MKVENHSYNKTFKSGLTNRILLKEKITSPSRQVKVFADRYGIEANFLNNRSAALANMLCLNLFENLATKLNLKLTLPPAIFSYKREDIKDPKMQSNFCIPDTMEVLKNEYPFPGRSIFFQDFENLEFINYVTETARKRNITSSSHFLAPFIHEWLHSFQMDYIYNKYGYGGSCNYLNEIYPNKSTNRSGVEILKEYENKTLSSKENQIILETLGEYATRPQNQYLEVFSEGFTKLICDCLKGIELVKNPIDEFKKMNKEYQKIIYKICTHNKD